MKWISCMCTYIPSLLGLPPTPVGHHRAPGWAPCATQQLPTSFLLYTWYCVYVSATLPIHPILSSFLPVSTCLFCMLTCLFLPWKQIYLYHLSKSHIHALMYLLFYFWLTSFCMTDSRSIHVSGNDPVLFLFMAVSMYHIFFIHSSVSGHFNSLRFDLLIPSVCSVHGFVGPTSHRLIRAPSLSLGVKNLQTASRFFYSALF